MLRIGTRRLALRPVVEDVGHRDAALLELAVGGLDVTHHEIGGPIRARLGLLAHADAERDRAVGPGWRELHDAHPGRRLGIDVEMPAGLLVEGLGPVHVGRRAG